MGASKEHVSTRAWTVACGLMLWCVTASGLAFAQVRPSFATQLYPALYKAGCRFCHNSDGVASATRLHFREDGASKEIINSFGDSLVESVDRSHPEQSLLLNKPTNRIKHSSGERIKKGSPEEALLSRWITYLASMPEATPGKRCSIAKANLHAPARRQRSCCGG